MLNPSLEVAHDVLVVKATQVGDFPKDSPFLLRVQLVSQLYFLDRVNVAVKSVTSLVNDTEAATANLLELFKITGVALRLTYLGEGIHRLRLFLVTLALFDYCTPCHTGCFIKLLFLVVSFALSHRLSLLRGAFGIAIPRIVLLVCQALEPSLLFLRQQHLLLMVLLDSLHCFFALSFDLILALLIL